MICFVFTNDYHLHLNAMLRNIYIIFLTGKYKLRQDKDVNYLSNYNTITSYLGHKLYTDLCLFVFH